MEPRGIRELRKRCNERRHKVNLPPIRDWGWDVLEGWWWENEAGQRHYIRDWERFWQTVRLTRQEAAALGQWLKDPDTYRRLERIRQVRQRLRAFWRQEGPDWVRSLRVQILYPPQDATAIAACQQAWIQKYRVPNLSWLGLGENIPEFLRPWLSCMDNEVSVAAYGVPGTAAHLLTLEDDQGQVYGRCILYPQEDGGTYIGTFYVLHFGQERTSLSTALKQRLQEELRALGTEPLDRVIGSLRPPLRLQPLLYQEDNVCCWQVPFVDDPRNWRRIICYRQTPEGYLEACPPENLQFITALSRPELLLPLDKSTKDMFLKSYHFYNALKCFVEELEVNLYLQSQKTFLDLTQAQVAAEPEMELLLED